MSEIAGGFGGGEGFVVQDGGRKTSKDTKSLVCFHSKALADDFRESGLFFE